jgi:hypothetical protein
MDESLVVVTAVLVLYLYLPGRSMILLRKIIKHYIPTDNSWERCNYRAFITSEPFPDQDLCRVHLRLTDPVGMRRKL